MERFVDFKRMVLGLPHSATDYASVAFTAQLAELLGLDIVGLFVEDESLSDLAALPCVREFRPLGGGWHPIDAAQLAQRTGQAAVEARRLFEGAAKALRIGTRFNRVKGSIADVVGSESTVDDIFVVIEPKNPAERMTHQYRRLMEGAFNGPAATLLVPSRINRRTGPVVAVVTGLQDPSLHAALRIATSSKERLIVLAPPGMDRVAMAGLAEASGVPVDWRPFAGEVTDDSELALLLSRINERFLVLSRARPNGLPPSQLTFRRGVPVLVTEPARAEKS